MLSISGVITSIAEGGRENPKYASYTEWPPDYGGADDRTVTTVSRVFKRSVVYLNINLTFLVYSFNLFKHRNIFLAVSRFFNIVIM